jgi:hypothetical protein
LIGGLRSFAGEITFTDVTAEAGLLKPLEGIMGHGAAVGDYDNDGLLDIYVGGFCDRPAAEYAPAAGPVPNRLLRNLGRGRFGQVEAPVLEFYGRTSGAVFADLDNDGTLDLYVANNSKGKSRAPEGIRRDAQLQRASLFQNQSGKFNDISMASGAAGEPLRTTRNIGVFDYDNDGLLDLFVVEDKFIKGPRSVLYRNLGKLTFKDVNAEVGLPDDIFGLGLAVADVNNDRRPDFFVPHSNRFFLSDGKGRYTEPAALREVFKWQPVDGEDWPCGAAFGDLDRDGDLDLVLGIHFKNARNRIYLNDGLKDGVPQFRDVTKAAGLPDSVAQKSPHVEIQDFDNDGWPDLYFSTAWLDADGNVTPLIYRGLGNKDGVPIFASPKAPAGELVYYPAGPSGDFDRDGRLDLFLVNWFRGNHCRLLRNTSDGGNWLQVEVAGSKTNRMGIGAKVRIHPAGETANAGEVLGFQEVTTGYGYASGQEAICHFGLGSSKTVDVAVELPDGQKLVKRAVPVNQRIVIKE